MFSWASDARDRLCELLPRAHWLGLFRLDGLSGLEPTSCPELLCGTRRLLSAPGTEKIIACRSRWPAVMVSF